MRLFNDVFTNRDKRKIKIENRGALRFWGDWFGRPSDNNYVVTEAFYDRKADVLVVIFRQNETCTVYNPMGIVNKRNKFYVLDATKIIWEWYYYGREQMPENLCRREYTRLDKDRVVVEYFDICENGKKYIDIHQNYAMELGGTT